MKERDCPKCLFTPLQPRAVGGVAIDECPKCGGRWYDLGELSASVKDPVKFRESLKAGPVRPREGSAICPLCHKKMQNGGIGGEFLRADFCPDCKGIWLDKSEIRLIDQLLA